MILLWVWLIGTGLSVVPLSRWFLKHEVGPPFDSEAYVMASFIGLMLAMVWPTVMVVVVVARLLRKGM